MSLHKPEVEDAVRRVLQEKFSLYQGNHLVFVQSGKDLFDESTQLFIGYYSSPRHFTTGFNLQLSGDLGYVLTFFIDEEFRGRGSGRQLYEAVNTICKEQGCKRLRVVPSGDGLGFWPAMGFKKCNEDELEARI